MNELIITVATRGSCPLSKDPALNNAFSQAQVAQVRGLIEYTIQKVLDKLGPTANVGPNHQENATIYTYI